VPGVISQVYLAELQPNVPTSFDEDLLSFPCPSKTDLQTLIDLDSRLIQYERSSDAGDKLQLSMDRYTKRWQLWSLVTSHLIVNEFPIRKTLLHRPGRQPSSEERLQKMLRDLLIITGNRQPVPEDVTKAW
jgi:hypothetical protein